MAKRNYKFAIPQYVRENDEIQYMLSIYLDGTRTPSCFLLLRHENDGAIEYYRGTTILTPEMAYNNARLIAGPELLWNGDAQTQAA